MFQLIDGGDIADDGSLAARGETKVLHGVVRRDFNRSAGPDTQNKFACSTVRALYRDKSKSGSNRSLFERTRLRRKKR